MFTFIFLSASQNITFRNESIFMKEALSLTVMITYVDHAYSCYTYNSFRLRRNREIPLH